MEAGQTWKCALCGVNPAAQFCICAFPLIHLCEICQTEHSRSPESHLFFPCSESVNISTSLDFKQVTARVASLYAASEAAKSNLPAIQTFQKTVEREYNQAILHLEQQKTLLLSELGKLEEDMSSYISETMEDLYSHILDLGYRPKPGLPAIAWSFRPGSDFEAAQIFLGTANGLSLRKLEDGVGVHYEITIRGFNENRRISEGGKPRIQEEKQEKDGFSSNLAFVFEDFLLSFNCVEETWGAGVPLERAVSAYGNSASVYLPDGSILCTGGGLHSESQSKVYRIIANGSVETIQKMTIPRSFHGICLYTKEFVYVFGGRSSDIPTNKCEKLLLNPDSGLSDRNWTEIPNMCSPREGCNPCVHSSGIFLCGGACDSVELFNPEENSFRLLEISLEDENSPSFAVVQDNLLYIISHEDLLIWDLEHETWSSRKHEAWGSWGNMSPLLIGERVYVPSLMMGGIIQINLPLLTSEMVGFPSYD